MILPFHVSSLGTTDKTIALEMWLGCFFPTYQDNNAIASPKSCVCLSGPSPRSWGFRAGRISSEQTSLRPLWEWPRSRPKCVSMNGMVTGFSWTILVSFKNTSRKRSVLGAVGGVHKGNGGGGGRQSSYLKRVGNLLGRKAQRKL